VSEIVSVVVPTCHRNDMLALCLERLAPGTQTLDAARYEVIITDDGRESTAQAMLTEKFPWAKWVEGPKRGPAANRNSGAKHASGAWIAFTDDDCLPEANWLEEMLKARDAQPNVVAFEGKTTCPDDLTNPMLEAPLNEYGGCMWSCNVLFHKADFLALRGFDEDFPFATLEDTDFRERLIGSGRQSAFVETAIVSHPARLRKTGIVRAKLFESDFMIIYKTGFQGSYLPLMLKHLVKRAIKIPIEYKFHSRAFGIAADTIVQFFYILQHGKEWEQKYRKKYKEVKIPYRDDVKKRLVF
jgi:GT2 family glycosyltransferase